MSIPDAVMVTIITRNLSSLLNEWIAYVEDSLTHPFLEEIISLFAAYMETS